MSVEKEKLQKDIFRKVDKIYQILTNKDFPSLISVGIVSKHDNSIIYNVKITSLGSFITSSSDGIWGITASTKISNEDFLDSAKKHLIIIHRLLKIESILKH